MGEFLKILGANAGQGDQLGILEVSIALTLSLLCVLLIATSYRFTHRGAGYSQSYVASLVIMALVTTLIMIVIGSNIARAFSLVGALSIIRFRNAVKETRDVAYIFFVMAIAMACGTRFYGVAMLATVVIIAVTIVMHLVDFAASKVSPERLLTVRMPPGIEVEAALLPALDTLFDRWTIISLETVRQGLYVDTVLSVAPREGVGGARVFEAIGEVNDNLKIVYRMSSNDEAI